MFSHSINGYLANLLQLSKTLDDDDPKIPDIQRPAARMIRTQLCIGFVLGTFNFLTFCFLRKKWPRIYSARVSRRRGLPQIKTESWFNWIKVVFKINETQVLEHAGLDAFVFLSFFKLAIKLLFAFSFFGFFIISPIRFHYTGGYDQGDGDDAFSNDNVDKNHPKNPSAPEEYEGYLWMYVVFTYLFTIIVVIFLFKQTRHVLNVRQEYLGKQNSITDRTIRLQGIPPELRNEERLSRHIEMLNIGKVESVVLCKEWMPLNRLFKMRQRLLNKLEHQWSEYLKPFDIKARNYTFEGIENEIFALSSAMQSQSTIQQPGNAVEPEEEASSASDAAPSQSFSPRVESQRDSYLEDIEVLIHDITNGSIAAAPYSDDVDEETELLNRRIIYSNDLHNIEDVSSVSNRLVNTNQLKRPKIRLGILGLRGPQVDAIEYYTKQLNELDEQIRAKREDYYKPIPTAFVTMESVAQAQMVAQAVLDPHANYLTTKLAPAPHDVIWDNICLSNRERMTKSYYITILITVISLLLIFPVSYLATLLNTKTISKFFPELGKFLETHKAAENFVTGLLPTYIFTLLNTIIPFLYVFLSSLQGFVSHGEKELSIVSKNFFYLFVNLFLVFTLAGTAANYWSFLSDTTQIAKQLATSLKDLSLFYVDLIIFQGIGMLPFKLLLFGYIFKWPFFYKKCTTPRDYKNLYKPPVFNFGLALPQPLLILIITIIYSVMSTKILISGLIYFIIGYYVYKYQLMYSMVHPPHSTGKVWPIVFRRIVLGLLIFQLTMAGLLALQNGFVLALCLIPLPFITIGFLYDFQKNYVPLCFFIALRSVKQFGSEFSDDENSELVPVVSTASEPQSIINPNLLGAYKTHTSQYTRNHMDKQQQTLDEVREKNLNYEYPYMIQALDGPWVAIDGSEIVMVNDENTVRKKMKFFEWE